MRWRANGASQFVGRILSVLATCRQQGRNVWEFLPSVSEPGSRALPRHCCWYLMADSSRTDLSGNDLHERLPRAVQRVVCGRGHGFRESTGWEPTHISTW